ncbi:hypothetical protein FDUTEX481_03936 [Tolypothrix sp. PCC 7601]|nr:hypothetical protein FDUTEX481_03936 [Tolypothrix sp. PCC 7601]
MRKLIVKHGQLSNDFLRQQVILSMLLQATLPWENQRIFRSRD